MGPTGNQQGGHYFMSLATGERLVRSRWTPLPMPREAQTRVNNFGSKQKMPKSLTFGDRHGQELCDNLDEVEEWSNEDDDTYKYEDNVDDDELSFDVVEDVVEDIIVDIPNEDPPTDQPSEVLPTDQTEDVGAPLIQPPITDDHANGENTGVEDVAPMADVIHSTDLMEDDLEAAGQITGVEKSLNEDDVSDGTVDYDSTEETEYEKPEQFGIESAHNDDMSLPKRVRKKKADEIYEYYNALIAGIDVDQVFCSYDDLHDLHQNPGFQVIKILLPSTQEDY